MRIKNNGAKSFVVIMIVIAVSAICLRILIEALLKINISQNESTASLTMKYISAALENYARDKDGIYPANFPFLVNTSPAYLDRNYISDSPIKGYSYSCPSLSISGYSCFAYPGKCRITGNTVYHISTGGILTLEDCRKDARE